MNQSEIILFCAGVVVLPLLFVLRIFYSWSKDALDEFLWGIFSERLRKEMEYHYKDIEARRVRDTEALARMVGKVEKQLEVVSKFVTELK